MVSSTAEGLIHSIKLSSVGPGSVTGPDAVFEPGNIDLAMKLHYLRGIYYFPSNAFEGLTVFKIKEPIFTWMNQFPVTCGRFRRAESGRPYIKCNDCGVRFIEAKCDKTLDEWLEMRDASLEKMLTSTQIIGPEIGFSPLVLLQFTKFKCGGMAVGLSWAHVLGDAFSAAEFINLLGKAAAGNKPLRPINMAHTLTGPKIPETFPKVVADPLSARRVDPIGDTWIPVNKCKMEPFLFNVDVTLLQSKLRAYGEEIAPFEAIAALIWRCMAKIRSDSEPKTVTICRKDQQQKHADGILSNNQVISVVKADFSVAVETLDVLAALMKYETVDDRSKIEEAMQRENGVADFVVYGANLTFVDLQDAKFYEFEYRGHKPVRVSCRIDGVGDEGAVLVIPVAEDGGNEAGEGRTVVAILPENEIGELKVELKKEGITV